MKQVAFGSCSFDDMESKYHYFTGKVVAGRYAIGQNSQFLWGCFFYWISDCTAVKEMIEYDGCIYMVHRWAQERLVYTLAVMYRPNRIMCGVDALSRR